jgi:hypothetical protein
MVLRPFAAFQQSPLALWCGRALLPTPEKRRALFERSEFARRRSRRTAQGTRRATSRPTWFWVLFPKEKDLVTQDETWSNQFLGFRIEKKLDTNNDHQDRPDDFEDCVR